MSFFSSSLSSFPPFFPENLCGCDCRLIEMLVGLLLGAISKTETELELMNINQLFFESDEKLVVVVSFSPKVE